MVAAISPKVRLKSRSHSGEESGVQTRSLLKWPLLWFNLVQYREGSLSVVVTFLLLPSSLSLPLNLKKNQPFWLVPEATAAQHLLTLGN